MSLVLRLLASVAVSLSLAQSDVRFQNVVVRQGDTLWGISNTWLKDPSKWDEILKYNKLPSSDPTVALPGMTLRVPINLIKESLRAARVIYLINHVLFRRQDSANWKDAALDMQLFRGDSVHTLEDAKAKVRFLNSELLSLDANSMAVIKPLHADYDVQLKSGGVFVGRSKVVTVSATITPKTRDTQYSAKVGQDLSTLVEVYTGVAAVAAQGQSVDVKAGMSTRVEMGLAPQIPTQIANLAEFEARAAEFTGSQVRGEARVKYARSAQLAAGADADAINAATDASDLRGDVASLSVGIPISGFRVQASRDREFEKISVDKTFEPEERVDFKNMGLAPGVYWFRISLIDLLGTAGKFSAPRLYSVGLTGAKEKKSVDLKEAVVVFKPSDDEEVAAPSYRVTGLIKHDGLTVTVNGRSVRQDEGGNFYSEVKLKAGPNDISVNVVDNSSGDSTTITRRVTYRGMGF